MLRWPSMPPDVVHTHTQTHTIAEIASLRNIPAQRCVWCWWRHTHTTIDGKSVTAQEMAGFGGRVLYTDDDTITMTVMLAGWLAGLAGQPPPHWDYINIFITFCAQHKHTAWRAPLFIYLQRNYHHFSCFSEFIYTHIFSYSTPLAGAERESCAPKTNVRNMLVTYDEQVLHTNKLHVK